MAADELICIIQKKDLELALPRKVVTQSARGCESIIDLIFLFKDLIGALTGCKIKKNLYHRSDHYPIATYLDLSPNIEPEIKKHAWKSADLAEILQSAKEQRFNLPILASEADINMYMAQITITLHQIEEKTVPWAKPSSKA